MFDKNQFLEIFTQNGIDPREAENIFNHAGEWMGSTQNPQEIVQNLTDWTNQHAGEFANVENLLNLEQSEGFAQSLASLLGIAQEGEGFLDGVMESLGGFGDFFGGGDSE